MGPLKKNKTSTEPRTKPVVKKAKPEVNVNDIAAAISGCSIATHDKFVVADAVQSVYGLTELQRSKFIERAMV